MRQVVRYLWHTSRHFRQVALLATGLGAVGVWTVVVMPRDAGAPYVPLLFGQVFCVSTGFRWAADSGHYDALLVSGSARRTVALGHWLLSAGPVITVWAIVAAVELAAVGAEAVGVGCRGLVALGFVSTLGWTLTLPTSRFVGGIAWMATLALVAMSPQGLTWLGEAVTASSIGGSMELVRIVGAYVVCPFLLLGPTVDGSPVVTWVVGVMSMLSVICLAGGVCWVVGRDFPGVG